MMRTLWRILTRKKEVTEGVEQSSLARVLNTFDLTALGVGSTLGVGLYVLVGKVAKETAGPSVVLSFLIAAVASAFAGLCYAEFGARAPRAGSAYIYSYVGVGEFIAFVIGWNLILEYIIGSASVARGMSLYIDALTNDTIKDTFYDIAPIGIKFLSPYFDFLSFSIAVVLSVGLAFGLKESSKANNVFTVLNIGVVLFVVIAGSTKADIKNWNLTPPSNSTDAGSGGFFPYGVGGMIKGAATCFYGFVGFDCIATTGEEAKNPQKAIPLAIILSLLIVFMAYFSVATVVTLMVPYYLQDVNSPIPHAFDEFGWEVAKWIVTIGGIFALMASLFGAMFPLPRILYAMASDGLIFRILGKVSTRFSTPVIGTLLAGLLTGLMAAMFEQGQLVDMMSIGTLLAYTIVAACVLLLRYSVDDESYALVRSDSDSSISTYSVNEDSTDEHKDNLVNDNANSDDMTCLAFTKQFFNIRKLSVPTKLSEKLVTLEIFFFCLLCLLLGFCAKYLIHDISQGVPYAIAIPSVIGFLMIITLMSISTQPHSKKSLHFKVPLVPLIPALSILANIYLMMALDVTTWIRFGVWMAIGLPIYLFSAHCASKDAHNACNSSIKANKKVSNGNTYMNAGYVDDEKIDNTENSDSAFYEENESGDDKVVEDCEMVIANSPKKKFYDRQMSVDTVSNCSNTVLHENVVALIHREDSRIVEEEEGVSRDEGLILFNFIQDIVKDEEENLRKSGDLENKHENAPQLVESGKNIMFDEENSISEDNYEADYLNAVDDINRIVEVEESKLNARKYSEAFNKTLPGDLSESVKAAVQELEMVIEIEEERLGNASSPNSTILELPRQTSVDSDIQKSSEAVYMDTSYLENKITKQSNPFVPPPPPPLPPITPSSSLHPFTPPPPPPPITPLISQGYFKSPNKSNNISSLPLKKVKKPAPQIPTAIDINNDVEIIKIGSEEYKNFSSKLKSLLTPVSLKDGKSEPNKFKFDVGKTSTIKNTQNNLIDENKDDTTNVSAIIKGFENNVKVTRDPEKIIVNSMDVSNSNTDDNQKAVENRSNIADRNSDNSEKTNRIKSSSSNTNDDDTEIRSNDNNDDVDENIDVATIKNKLNNFLKSRMTNPTVNIENNKPEANAKRKLSKTFPRNKDQLIHKEQMQQTLNSIKLRMLETNTNTDDES